MADPSVYGPRSSGDSAPAAPGTPLTEAQHALLHSVAAILLPGDGEAPSAAQLDDFDTNLDRALIAMGSGAQMCIKAMAELPSPLDWDTLRIWATAEPELFEPLATLVSGAYFMSPIALDAIGYPHGPRRRAPHDLAAEELGSGLLDPMLARASMVRGVPA